MDVISKEVRFNIPTDLEKGECIPHDIFDEEAHPPAAARRYGRIGKQRNSEEARRRSEILPNCAEEEREEQEEDNVTELTHIDFNGWMEFLLLF
jgi:hypothetical protein